MNLDNKYLKAWLAFNQSPTEDILLNHWTTYGNPTIGTANAFNGNALQLDGQSYIKLSGLQLGGQDFYIDGLVYVDSSSPNNARLISIVNPSNGYYLVSVRKNKDNANRLDFWNNSYADVSKDNGYTNVPAVTSVGQRVHFKLIYRYSDKIFALCINDTTYIHRTNTPQYNRQSFDIYIGALPNGNQGLIGSIDELRIYDGTWFSYGNGNNLPTLEEYQQITFTADVERKVSNVARLWRYVNLGTADSLTVTGTTLTDLPETKSITGTAFYQAARAKCFDLPSTPEVWIKFDVYFDGSNRWRAYNGGANGVTGITAQTNNEISYFTNGGDNSVHSATNAAKKNQLQTVLLHMISGSSAGIIEAWVDGTKIYTYTGDVNHGQDFADIYLQSDGAGTFFSNVIISNRQLTQADGYQTFTADVERKLSNVVEFTADVERYLIEPLIVPFLMGEHFNHYIRSIIVSNSPTTFKLPKKSKVYIHATSPVDTSPRAQWRAVRIFTDTDAAGTVTGDVYATFDECERVSIQSTVSPQSILSDFTWKLRDLGGDKLDAAIEYCTGGLFTTKDELADSFLTDLDNSESNLDFLLRCCGVDLSNDDTGAVVGSDAGGGHPKTTKLIVPEPVPVEEWVVPGSGSSKYIYGLTVYFPTTGANGALTDAEKHILAGLNSVWIYQALWLIDKSCKMEFANLPTQRTRSISVKFVNETNNTLAYVAATYSGNWAIKLELCINMRVYSAIDITSEDGATSNQNDTYLDRTLAHEFTHAVMAAGIGRYSDLPLFIKEGIAEFIHGIDDEKRSSIRHITQPAQRGTLQTIFSTGGTAGDEDVYSAGYLFFRYMVRQTLERGNLPLPPSDTMYNLVISDGAIDYFGRALTDNTRATLNADTLRELVRTTSFNADVAIFDTIQIEFDFDINRAIKGKVKLFAIDTSEYFSGGGLSSSGDSAETLTPTVIPSQEIIPAAPDNTNGLQSVEISLGEQQLTDNVSFVGVVPFDIMFPVQGQYLDYVFDMRVERVQQRGVLYTCDCCVDVDQLLYTQIAYTVPPSTDWHGAGESSPTTSYANKSVLASWHATSIARTIGKTPVMQFDNFQSTVIPDEKGGATYADLIRDVFGWSSRVPTHMINVFIRNDKIYFVQRGHEARLIDLTGTKHTIPIVTHELVRMTWGSTPWSQTETREVEVYRPPDTSTSSSSSGTGGTGGGSGTGSIGGGSGSGSGSESGTGSGSGSGDITVEEPDDGGGNEKNAWLNVGKVTTEDSNGVTVTTYTYDKDGVLKKTVAEFTSKKDDKENNTKTTTNNYNSDGLIRQTSTTVRYPNDFTSNSRVITTYGYLTLADGKKFLSTEMVSEYDANDKLVDQRVTTKSPTGRGQGTSDDDAGGSSGSGNIGDDRVTPYQLAQANKTGEAAFENALGSYDSTWDKTLADYTSKMEHSTPTPAQVQELKEKFQKSFNDAFSSNHEADYYTERQSRTLNGLSLYDSSFPIHNVGKLMELTEAVRWLNRRTKETVTMTIYEYPHLIDFNDRILFNGAQYFLVSNVAMTNARVFNEQRVTFTRWY